MATSSKYLSLHLKHQRVPSHSTSHKLAQNDAFPQDMPHVLADSDYQLLTPSYVSAEKHLTYSALAFSACLAYDQLITFDIEVARIWTLSGGLPKFIFFVNRYVVVSILITNGIVIAILGGSFEMSEMLTPRYLRSSVFMAYWQPWVSVVALMTVGTIQTIRVSALYGQSKYLPRLLKCLLLCAMVAEVVNTSILTKNTSASLSNERATGLLGVPPKDAYSLWIPFACFEGIIMTLTMYRVIPYRNNLSPTLRMFARDSIIYFSIMFSSLLCCLFLIKFDPAVGTIFVHPSNCIACIAVSRMMLNIRGLSIDDMDDTQLETSIHFRQLNVPQTSYETRAEGYAVLIT